VGLQVCGGCTIFRILITTNPTSLVFASFGSALEKMISLIAVSADLDIALEKSIGRRAPGIL
jgi:hypothetical protein